jgi:glycosyltransferase A (GT-A) superfamily protein (DUF2064 family)
MTRTAIIFFCRRWDTEAQVKFGRGCSPDASRAVEAMARSVLNVASTAGVDILWYSDVMPDARMAACLGIHTVALQRGATLRDRLINAFVDGFNRGYERLCLVGGDTTLTNEALQEALSAHGIVIGPSLDGGFYLLAASSSQEVLQVLAAEGWNNGALDLHMVPHTTVHAEPDFDTMHALQHRHPDDVVRATAARALCGCITLRRYVSDSVRDAATSQVSGRAPPGIRPFA